jgi:hypothetical protein
MTHLMEPMQLWQFLLFGLVCIVFGVVTARGIYK